MPFALRLEEIEHVRIQTQMDGMARPRPVHLNGGIPEFIPKLLAFRRLRVGCQLTPILPGAKFRQRDTRDIFFGHAALLSVQK